MKWMHEWNLIQMKLNEFRMKIKWMNEWNDMKCNDITCHEMMMWHEIQLNGNDMNHMEWMNEMKIY